MKLSTTKAFAVCAGARQLPRAILLGVLCVIVVYLSANTAYLHVLGAEGLAATRTPAADVAARVAGGWGAKAISFLIRNLQKN